MPNTYYPRKMSPKMLTPTKLHYAFETATIMNPNTIMALNPQLSPVNPKQQSL